MLNIELGVKYLERNILCPRNSQHKSWYGQVHAEIGKKVIL